MRRIPAPTWWLAAALSCPACAGQCGALGGLPPTRPPLVKTAEGARYLVQRGEYKAYYDAQGRLQRLEKDADGDGHPEEIAYHDGQRIPRRVEVDANSDGRIERWEAYDAEGVLSTVGTARRGGAADMWVTLDARGAELRREYDDDGDGRVDRRETLQGTQVVAVELDGDHDGRIDLWQTLGGGRLLEEQLDTDGDGRPDSRLRYGARGQVLGLEIVAAR